MNETAVTRMRSKLAQTYARKLVTGSSLLACGVAAGVAAASSHRVALAATALVIEIGSAIVVMHRGLKAFDTMVRRDRLAHETATRGRAEPGEEIDGAPAKERGFAPRSASTREAQTDNRADRQRCRKGLRRDRRQCGAARPAPMNHHTCTGA